MSSDEYSYSSHPNTEKKELDLEVKKRVATVTTETESDTDGQRERKRKANSKYVSNDAKKPRLENSAKGAVDSILLQKSKKAMLDNSKWEKEARRGAVEDMLKNWQQKIPCEKCSELMKEIQHMKEMLSEREKSISTLREEVDDLEYWLKFEKESANKLMPGNFDYYQCNADNVVAIISPPCSSRFFQRCNVS